MSDESGNKTTGGFLSGRWPLIALAGLILVSLAAVCALGYSLLGSDGLSLGDDSIDIGGADPEPTPFSQVAAGSPGSGEAIVYGISDNSTITVTLDAPLSLRLDDREFSVVPQTINPDSSWSPGISSDSAAGWVHGSIINYIMALQPSSSNMQWAQALTPGTEMVLTTQSGTDLIFEVEGTRQVPADDQSVFGQLSPGITLLLMGDGDEERLVIDGRYVISESPGASGPNENSPEIGLGEAVQLEDLQVTINNATYMPDHPDTPPGFAFFILDGVLQNTGGATIDAGTLRLILADEVGNQYALNPVASRLGNNAPLTGGFLSAGQSLLFSVGYQIPLGLSSTALNAQVVRRDTGTGVRIEIPFSGGSAAENAQINLQSVVVSEDLSSLTMSGQVTNSGAQPFVVAQADVTLRTPDGASFLILSSNPPFPWTVPGGQTLLYSVTFQRPQSADSAIFTILNQPFQLDNLR
jgi:hypothetical protein